MNKTITLEEAKEILAKEYHRDNFLYLADFLLPDLKNAKHEVKFDNNIFDSVMQLGKSSACDIVVYEVILNEDVQNRRVAITQEMFRILRGLQVNNALVAFSNSDGKNYRLSLLTSKYEFDGDKIVKVISNPRRYSYSLGFGTKTKTAYDFLIKKGKVRTLDELVGRFSIEVVNKLFYAEIAECFTKLVGGERDRIKYEPQLELYSVNDKNKYTEFAVRLIGRIVFCWFLREKKSAKSISLMPETILSIDAIKQNENYYHNVLEPLFFELLNTKQAMRKDKFANEDIYKQIPYLNGGLFSPHNDDYYEYSPTTESGRYGLVNIPGKWFESFFQVLGQYNFTVDENTAYDMELSIDPEMLGRIFENLLAEINPQTGESAKKSTGSFYTPREIVDYMVDCSLYEYLHQKTNIDGDKLRAIISYGKENDEKSNLQNEEKKKIVDAIYTITVLDPACGSGAFPIGMLQKLVYILQELDPKANMWFDKATENVGVLLKKEFQKKFNAGSLDYIRKLSVIQNSIFGVDIQPIAVEIARLRCFLSLIIEEKVDDNEENRGINSLPNLDFKFVIANALIGLKEEAQTNAFHTDTHIRDLKNVREEYFNADYERRTELKQEFDNIQNEMFKMTINQGNTSSKYELLSYWKPFENETTPWFDAEWMFGVKDGFDVVIGNPPYISIEGLSKEDRSLYKSIFKFFYHRYDLFGCFIEQGTNLLKKNGILCFIQPSVFLNSKSFMKIREYIVNNCCLKSLNLLKDGIFDSAVVPTMIMCFSKKHMDDNKIKCSQGKLENFYSIRQIVYKTTEANVFNLDLNDDVAEFIKKTSKKTVLLGDIARISRAINVGNYAEFLVNGAKFDNNENYIKVLKGGSIRKWYFEYKDFYLKKCFDEFVSCGDLEVLNKPKLMMKRIGKYPNVCYDNTGISGLDTIYTIRVLNDNFSSKYVLGLLNSKLIGYIFRLRVPLKGDVFPEFRVFDLNKQIPIKDITLEQQLPIIALVNEILEKKKENPNEDTSEEEKEIDKLVYILYNLEYDEVKIIDPEFALSKEEYEERKI